MLNHTYISFQTWALLLSGQCSCGLLSYRCDVCNETAYWWPFTLSNTVYMAFTFRECCQTDLKDMKSSWLANVMTRLLSSLGVGNRYLRMLDTCVRTVSQLSAQTAESKEQLGVQSAVSRHSPSGQAGMWSCEIWGGGRPRTWSLNLEHHVSLPHCKVWNKLWVQMASGTRPVHLQVQTRKDSDNPSAASHITVWPALSRLA